MHGCIPFPRNNLWFGEYGCLPVLLTNQQPIRFFQLSFPLSYFLPGTRRVGWNIQRSGYKCRHYFLITKNFFIIFYGCNQIPDAAKLIRQVIFTEFSIYGPFGVRTVRWSTLLANARKWA